MKYLISIFVFISIFIDFSLSSCGKETKDFLACRKKSETDLKNRKSTIIKNLADFKKEIYKCFSTNGCKEPASLFDESADEKNKIAEDKVFSKCANLVRRNVNKNAQKCVQEKLDKNFAFLDIDEHDFDGSRFQGVTSWRPNGIEHKIYQSFSNDSLCPASTNTTKLTQCVNEVFEKSTVKCRNHFLSAVERENDVALLCKAGCFETFNDKCNGKLNSSYSIICDCYSIEEKNDGKSFNDHVTSFDVCYRKANGTETYKNTNHVEGIVGSLRARFQSGNACNTVPQNPCSESTLNHDKIVYKPKYLNIP